MNPSRIAKPTRTAEIQRWSGSAKKSTIAVTRLMATEMRPIEPQSFLLSTTGSYARQLEM